MIDVGIIGGGLAGLTAAIHFAKAGFKVYVFEKKGYPQHKVCGEYISAEVLPYFSWLGHPLEAIQANRIQRFRLHGPNGAYVESTLPLGGVGIRRYTLDQSLYRYAQELGVTFHLQTTIKNIQKEKDHLQLIDQKGVSFTVRMALGSFGKRSNLDRHFTRPFFDHKAHYVGVKFYVQAPFPKDLVALYNFAGGYAGAVQVEDGSIDIAYLVENQQLQKAGSIQALETEVLFQNPAIRTLFCSGNRIPAKALTISNVSFAPKSQVINHALMIGDAAGMIPPLAGNGMAMGIHAAKIATELGIQFLQKQIDRDELEKRYKEQWRNKFAHRLFWGRRLHRVMGKTIISNLAVGTLQRVPRLLAPIVRQTHGEPIL